MGDITTLLTAWRQGDAGALESLTPLVYDELRRRASAHLARERRAHTLQPTALVHEAYLKLMDQEALSFADRAHFYALAARLMRQILVDHARSKGAAKRGGDRHRVSWHEDVGWSGPGDIALLDLDRALDTLKERDERQARLVELRFFGGLSITQTAEVMVLSPATVKREWRLARAFLARSFARS